MNRLRRLLNRLRPRARWTPQRRGGPMYDPAFIAASFRSGETVNPLSAELE